MTTPITRSLRPDCLQAGRPSVAGVPDRGAGSRSPRWFWSCPRRRPRMATTEPWWSCQRSHPAERR